MWEKHLASGGAGLERAFTEYDPALPCLLCLHGSGGYGAEFLPLLRELKGLANGAALDLPGHGNSPGPGRQSVWDYAAWVAGFLEAGPVRPVLLGNSLGGAIALALGLTRPELLSGLVLWGTGARLRVLPAILEGFKNDFPATVAMLTGLAYAPESAQDLKQAGGRGMGQAGAEVLWGDYHACDQFDVMDRLSEISLPTLVVCGEHDQLTPIKYSQYLASHIAGASLEAVPGAGHVLHQEKPRASAQTLIPFLNRLKP